MSITQAPALCSLERYLLFLPRLFIIRKSLVKSTRTKGSQCLPTSYAKMQENHGEALPINTLLIVSFESISARHANSYYSQIIILM
jgi:hypothetical protein